MDLTTQQEYPGLKQGEVSSGVSTSLSLQIKWEHRRLRFERDRVAGYTYIPGCIDGVQE